jgi:hypothetical protein
MDGQELPGWNKWFRFFKNQNSPITADYNQDNNMLAKYVLYFRIQARLVDEY